MAYIKQMDGLRGISSLWVTSFHFLLYLNACKSAHFGFLQPIILHGYFGVDIFFVLSGFIIHSKYKNYLIFNRSFLQNYVEFLVKRIARIYPVYIFSLSIIVILFLLNGLTDFVINFGKYDLSSFLKTLLMIQTWFFSSSVWCWNMPAWSVSVEWFLYIFYPILCILITLNNSRRQNIFLWSTLLLVILGCLSIKYTQFFLMDAMKLGLIRGILEFSLGALFYEIIKTMDESWFYDVLSCLTICFLVFFIRCKLLAASFVLVLLCVPLLTISSGTIGRTLSSKLFTQLGKLSYSIYMLGFGFQVLSNNLFKIQVNYNNNYLSVLMFFLHVCLLVIISALVYSYIEKPLRGWLISKFFPSYKKFENYKNYFVRP